MNRVYAAAFPRPRSRRIYCGPKDELSTCLDVDSLSATWLDVAGWAAADEAVVKRLAVVSAASVTPASESPDSAFTSLSVTLDHEGVIRHPPQFRVAQLDVTFDGPNQNVMHVTSATVPTPVTETAIWAIGRPGLVVVVLGIALMAVSVPTAIVISWLGLAILSFASYASARRHQGVFLMGPAMAGYSTLICSMLAVTAVIAAISS